MVGLGLLSRIGWGDRWRRLFADLYPGYGRSSAGLAVGAAWAFTDGVVAGFGFAWLYNALTRIGRSSRFASQFPFGDSDARQHSLDDYGD